MPIIIFIVLTVTSIGAYLGLLNVECKIEQLRCCHLLQSESILHPYSSQRYLTISLRTMLWSKQVQMSSHCVTTFQQWSDWVDSMLALMINILNVCRQKHVYNSPEQERWKWRLSNFRSLALSQVPLLSMTKYVWSQKLSYWPSL